MEAKNNFIVGVEDTPVDKGSGVDCSVLFLFFQGEEGEEPTDWNKLVRDLATVLGAGVIHTFTTSVAVLAVTL